MVPRAIVLVAIALALGTARLSPKHDVECEHDFTTQTDSVLTNLRQVGQRLDSAHVQQ